MPESASGGGVYLVPGVYLVLGVYLVSPKGGVWSWGGLSGPGVCLVLEGCLVLGVSGPGGCLVPGVSAPGVCGIPSCTEADTPP